MLDPEILALWIAALNDASIRPTDAILYAFPRSESAKEGLSAVFWRAGGVTGTDDPEVEKIRNELNEKGVRSARRVGVWTDRSAPGIAGLLRHELEHSRQFFACSKLADLHRIAEDVLRGVPDSGRLYQLIPTEIGANATASTFVRSHFGDPAIDDLVASDDQDVALFRRGDTPALSLTDLPRMLLQYFIDHRDLCINWAETSSEFRRRLNSAWKGAGTAWESEVSGVHADWPQH